MRAFVIDEPGKTRVIEVERPSPGPEEVLLRTRVVGMCGTDLSTFRGKNPLVTYPRIPGHEIAATIAETMRDEATAFMLRLLSPEAKEAFAAFLEKRKADFSPYK